MKSGQIAIIKLCFISRMTAAVWHAARTEKIFEQTAAEKAAAALRHVTWELAEKGAPFSDLWPRARLGIVEELFAGDGNKDDVTDRVKQVQLLDSAAADFQLCTEICGLHVDRWVDKLSELRKREVHCEHSMPGVSPNAVVNTT